MQAFENGAELEEAFNSLVILPEEQQAAAQAQQPDEQQQELGHPSQDSVGLAASGQPGAAVPPAEGSTDPGQVHAEL